MVGQSTVQLKRVVYKQNDTQAETLYEENFYFFIVLWENLI